LFKNIKSQQDLNSVFMSDNELKKNIELKNKDDVIIKYEKDK
jgi:hypothetical protein